MADTVKTPLGAAQKKTVIGVVVVVGGLAAVVYYRSRKSAAAANAATTATPAAAAANSGYGAGYSSDPYPPDGTQGNPSDPYSTDPSTGMTYGDEQASQYGSSGAFGGYGGYGYGGGGGGNTYGTGGQFTTNAEWSQYVEQYLTGQEGLDPNTVGNAIGKYITGQGVTADQQTVIEQAIAIGGYPPVNGPAGYPPSIQLVKGTGPGPGSSSVQGLKAADVRFDNITVTWRAAKGATSYSVEVTDHRGKHVASGTTTTTRYTARGLKQKTEYAFHVSSVPGGTGQKPAVTRATTK